MIKNDPETHKEEECICPRCRKRHIQRLFWSGRGTPRIYCSTCLKAISGLKHAAAAQPAGSRGVRNE